tara:strand:- start:407 stop:784 length:378 start_codon:yes stop_codon:yes gene_type:complete
MSKNSILDDNYSRKHNLQIIEELENGSIIRLNSLDKPNCGYFKEIFKREIIINKRQYNYEISKNIYADFSNVKSINSKGIVLIIQAHKLAVFLGVNLIICKASDFIINILKLTDIQLCFSNNFNS